MLSPEQLAEMAEKVETAGGTASNAHRRVLAEVAEQLRAASGLPTPEPQVDPSLLEQPPSEPYADPAAGGQP